MRKSTSAALWAALARNPNDTAAKSALADYYEENGRRDLAHALRWCIARKKWPSEDVYVSVGEVATSSWTWRDSSDYWGRDCLPSGVYAYIENDGDHPGWRSYDSQYAAIRALAASLKNLKSLYECEVK